MANTIVGKVYRINKPKFRENKNTGKTYATQEIFLQDVRYDSRTGEKLYENHVMFEFGGDKIHQLDNFKVGDMVQISFGIQGRFYTDKTTMEERFFQSVHGSRIEPYQQRTKNNNAVQHREQQSQQTYFPDNDNNNDTPF